MRNRFGSMIVAGATVAVLTVLGFGVYSTPGQAQGAAYRAPRTPDGKPNLNGIFQALNTAHWDLEPHAAGPTAFPELLGAMYALPPGQGVVEGNQIPYKPEALAKKKENFAKRLDPASFADVSNRSNGDPEARCYMPGVPRATYMPFPFQIVQTPQYILMAYEFASATRTIYMNSKESSPAESWMGWSKGRWEGETLVVDVTDFNDGTWFDRAGNYHSNALKVTERYTAASPNHLQYEATIEDPNVFTRPWKIAMPLYRRLDANVQLMEFKCVEFAEPLLYQRLIKKPSR